MKKNNLVTIFLSFLFISSISISYGKVYSYKQPDGTILLTDDPQKGSELVDYNENTWTSSSSQRPDVQKILDDSRNIGINDNDKSSDNQSVKNNNKPNKDSVEILYPTNEAYIRNGLGELLVKTTAELQDDQALKASIDGSLDDNLYETPSFLMKNIDRGEHILLVSLVKKSDGTIISTSNPIKFFMYRNIIRQNRPLPAN